MTPHSFQTLQSSLQALPVAMVFTSQLRLTQHSSVTNYGAPEQEENNLLSRATRVTLVLKSIQGYDHGGLNE